MQYTTFGYISAGSMAQPYPSSASGWRRRPGWGLLLWHGIPGACGSRHVVRGPAESPARVCAPTSWPHWHNPSPRARMASDVRAGPPRHMRRRGDARGSDLTLFQGTSPLRAGSWEARCEWTARGGRRDDICANVMIMPPPTPSVGIGGRALLSGFACGGSEEAARGVGGCPRCRSGQLGTPRASAL